MVSRWAALLALLAAPPCVWSFVPNTKFLGQHRSVTAMRSAGLVGQQRRTTVMTSSGVVKEETREKSSELPYPAIGDIVKYPGKWEGEYGIGQIRFLQCVTSRNAWIADIAPFKDVSEDQYRAQKGAGLLTHDVTSLAPLSAFYIGSTDAYKIIHKQVNGTRVAVTMKPGYRTEGFTLKARKVDAAVVEKARGEYNALKTRILTDTGLFGLAGTALAVLNAGFKDGAIFAVGVAASLVYLALLQRKADGIGAPQGNIAAKIGAGRFLVPVALVAGLAARHASDSTALPLNYLPQDEFWAGTLGFLSYRVPMLGREVGEIIQRRAEDSNIPIGGTARAGKMVLEKLGGKGTRAAAPVLMKSQAYRDEVTVLLLSGPPGMNKRKLAERLIKEDAQQRFAAPVWVTTRDPRPGEVDGEDVTFIEDFAFQVLKEQDRLLVSYQDTDGSWYGLRPSDVTEVTSKKGKASIVALDAFQADRMLTLDGARLIAVWVSMNSVDGLKQRYRSIVSRNKDLTPEEIERRVELLLVKATGDIEHGLLDAGYYEYTVYDDEGPDQTFQKLRDFADFALTI